MLGPGVSRFEGSTRWMVSINPGNGTSGQESCGTATRRGSITEGGLGRALLRVQEVWAKQEADSKQFGKKCPPERTSMRSPDERRKPKAAVACEKARRQAKVPR